MKKIITFSLVTISMLGSFAHADSIIDAQDSIVEETNTVMATSNVEDIYAGNSTATNVSKNLTQSINLGYANTAGVIDSTIFTGKYIAGFATQGYQAKELRVGFDFSAFYNKVEDTQKTEQYMANLGLEQNIVNGWFGYGALTWYRNEALGYKNKVTVGAGIGKMLFSDSTHSLKVKLGVAYNIADFAGLSAQEALEANDSYATLTQYLEYNRALSKSNYLYIKIGASESFDNFDDIEGIGVFGLNFAVAENISISLEEEIQYNGLSAFSNALDSKFNTKTVVRIGYNF